MTATATKPLRIVLSKVGLDGHDRGVKVVARALKDAGFEVIYTGLRQTPETLVEAAIQEDADLIGISMLSAAHMTIFPRVLELLESRGARRIGLFGGGIIPSQDIDKLEKDGVLKLFGPGTPLAEIIDWCRAYQPPSAGGSAQRPTSIPRSQVPVTEIQPTPFGASPGPAAKDRHHVTPIRGAKPTAAKRAPAKKTKPPKRRSR